MVEMVDVGERWRRECCGRTDKEGEGGRCAGEMWIVMMVCEGGGGLVEKSERKM